MPLRAQVLDEGRARGRRVAHAKGLGGGIGQSPPRHILARASTFGTLEMTTVIVRGRLESGAQFLLLIAARGIFAAPTRQLDAGARGQNLEHFHERQIVDALEEGNLITARAAGTIAMPSAAPRVDLEAGRALLMERTARFPQHTPLAQRGYAFTNHVLDGGAVLNGFDGPAEVVV